MTSVYVYGQVIPSSELDLDLSNKEQLGSGVYSGRLLVH